MALPAAITDALVRQSELPDVIHHWNEMQRILTETRPEGTEIVNIGSYIDSTGHWAWSAIAAYPGRKAFTDEYFAFTKDDTHWRSVRQSGRI